MSSDASVSSSALTAASIIAACILGTPAAQPQPSSGPDTLLCDIGSGSTPHSLVVSSISACGSQKSTQHLTASASIVFPETPQPAIPDTHSMQLCTKSGRQVTCGNLPTRKLATVASIDRSQSCGGLDGYTVHPAAADSSLHLGDVAGRASKGTSRVPVGFGAYRTGKAGAASSECQSWRARCLPLRGLADVGSLYL